MSGEELARVQQAKDLGFDPLMEKTLIQLLLDIPKRIVALLSKMLGKEMLLRIFGAVSATYLVNEQKIDGWVWLVAVIILIFGKQGLDAIKDIQK